MTTSEARLRDVLNFRYPTFWFRTDIVSCFFTRFLRLTWNTAAAFCSLSVFARFLRFNAPWTSSIAPTLAGLPWRRTLFAVRTGRIDNANATS
jgi:hypothetical protein